MFGIVKQSGGAIGVESAVGQGTTFEVWFPTTDRPTSDLESAVKNKRFIVGVTGWENSEAANITTIWACLALSLLAADLANQWQDLFAKDRRIRQGDSAFVTVSAGRVP